MEEIRIEEARRAFADLVNAAQWRGEHVTITRHGKPAAVLVPVDWHRRATRALTEQGDSPPH